MGALTIKNYSFTYRPWELEKAKTYNLDSATAHPLELQFKNNRMIRILPDFNNYKFITNTIRFNTIQKHKLKNAYCKKSFIKTKLLSNKVTMPKFADALFCKNIKMKKKHQKHNNIILNFNMRNWIQIHLLRDYIKIIIFTDQILDVKHSDFVDDIMEGLIELHTQNREELTENTDVFENEEDEDLLLDTVEEPSLIMIINTINNQRDSNRLINDKQHITIVNKKNTLFLIHKMKKNEHNIIYNNNIKIVPNMTIASSQLISNIWNNANTNRNYINIYNDYINLKKKQQKQC